MVTGDARIKNIVQPFRRWLFNGTLAISAAEEYSGLNGLRIKEILVSVWFIYVNGRGEVGFLSLVHAERSVGSMGTLDNGFGLAGEIDIPEYFELTPETEWLVFFRSNHKVNSRESIFVRSRMLLI